MKKVLAMGIIVVLSVSLFVGLIPSSVVASPDWIIDGDTVYMNDTNVYLSASPHTISSSGWVYFNVTTKTYTGDIDVVWGFDVPNVKPIKAELYQPHYNNWTTNRELTFYNVSSFSPSEDFCFYGNSYNTHHYNVTHETCSHWNHSTGECDGYKFVSSVVCFDSQTNDGTNYTVYWHTDHSELILWTDISSSFTKVDYNHGGMNKWYYVKNLSVVAGQSRQVRAWVDVPISIEGVSGKYWWAVKPSSETISEAISNNHFYALDPWYNSSWSHRKQWTVTNVNATTLTNYPAYVNVTDEPEMQADWDDVVFTDSSGNLIAYELENYTSGFADYWVNISSLTGSGTYTGWMYYGNDGASSQENPEGVYDSHTKMVQHLQEAPANDIAGHLDSTSNNNDGTPKNFDSIATSTTDGTGKIDGADVFDGLHDYVDCGNFDIDGDGTIVAWIYPLSTVGNKAILMKMDSVGLSKYADLSVYIDDGFLKMQIGDGTNYQTTVSTLAVSANTWQFVAVSVDGTNIKFYVDGNTQSVSQTHTPAGNAYKYSIGRLGEYNGFYFNGTIAEVGISSTARSADWINQSYQLVTNQSTYVTWGSAEQKTYTPPDPTNIANTTGNFWVNYTWSAGSGNVTNGYNVSNGTVWANNTNTFYNESVSASEWVNITVYAWNSSGGGTSSASSVSDQVQVSAADTTFTVSLPVGYTKPVFQPPNSTATNYPPNGQSSSQEFYNVTNAGNVNLDVRMRLNATVSTITLKADADNNPTGADTIGTDLVTVYPNLGQGSSVNVWLWSDFDHTPTQTANRTIYINVSQS